MNKFIPVCKKDLIDRNIDSLDYILISGDAYVDHPSFANAIIARTLENAGYSVGIISQPRWNTDEDFKKLGTPKYAFLVSSGNIDSMVNHFSVNKKRRHVDSYSPGGISGLRPDRATIVYCNKIREYFGSVPIIIGGIEPSLRRFAHYDYISDKIKRSILFDSQADLLVYGMGEKTILEIANLLFYGQKIQNITSIKGTCYASSTISSDFEHVLIPSFEEIIEDKLKFNDAYRLSYREQDSITGKAVAQMHGNKYLIQNPPQRPLSTNEMDETYNLPFLNVAHPMYDSLGEIPALQEVKFSITSHRGCFGSCSFCALTFHQGRTISHRSEKSIIEEGIKLTKLDGFKGYIHDVGGPTANFREKSCKKQIKHGICKDKECMYPKPCENLIVDHTGYLNVLRKLRKLDGVKKVFVRSGIRYDYLMLDKDKTFLKELCEHHISGQLKVAPEHISPKVLKYMGKPNINVYNDFVKEYNNMNEKLNKKQFLVPYLMSSHPGCDLDTAVDLAMFIKGLGHYPEQVQDFYPTPGSLSTCIFYTGVHPFTGEKVYVPKENEEKSLQRSLIQFNLPENKLNVKKALKLTKRENLYNILISQKHKSKSFSKNKIKNKK